MLKAVLDRIPRRSLYLWGGLLVTVVITEICLTLIIPYWRELFFSVLEVKEVNKFYIAVALFLGLMGGLGAAQGLKVWLGQRVSFMVREAWTKTLFRRWVNGEKNPNTPYGQALTESIQNATELYLEILVEIVISASIVITLILGNLHSPMLLIASLIYTVVVSLVAALFNKPLIGRDLNLQKANGEFRSTLTKIASGIDEYKYSNHWSDVVSHYYKYISIQMYFTLFTRVKGALAPIVPYLLLVGPLFAGAITLGQFMAGVAVFELIVVNSTIILMLYPKLTKAKASRKLIQEFTLLMEKEDSNGGKSTS